MTLTYGPEESGPSRTTKRSVIIHGKLLLCFVEPQNAVCLEGRLVGSKRYRL